MSHDPSLFERSPGGGPREPSFKMSTRQLGVVVLFVSLSILFLASLVGYAVTRLQNDLWRPPGSPGLPPGLFASTALLAGVSIAVHLALRSVRRNRLDSLVRSLWLTLAFAAAFLVGQTLNWHAMLAVPGLSSTLYAFTFYLLTGLHAVHVAAGFVPLGVVLARARRREYTSSHHEGVSFCVQYWDFLGVVWLVLLTTLHVFT